MHATTTPTQAAGTRAAPLVRPPRRGEGRQCARYADQAMHGLHGPQWLAQFASFVDTETINTPNPHEFKSKNFKLGGAVMSSPHTRVLDIGEAVPVGMIHSNPPLNWIIESSKVPVTALERFAASLVEINLLAVHRKQRRRGYGSLLLANAEAHYKALGFTVAMVVIDDTTDPTLRPWYERRGYRFHEHTERALIQPFAGDAHRIPYGAVIDGQLAGFKSLASLVASVDRQVVTALGPGGMRPAPREVLLVKGVIG